jgi:hypothetical protein
LGPLFLCVTPRPHVQTLSIQFHFISCNSAFASFRVFGGLLFASLFSVKSSSFPPPRPCPLSFCGSCGNILRRFLRLLSSSFPDTISKVIHPAARKPRTAPQSTVNNFAAPAKSVVNKKDVSVAKTLRSGDHRSGRMAQDAAWSLRCRSERSDRRTPADPRAPVQRSQRTAPREGSCIRVTGDRAMSRRSKTAFAATNWISLANARPWSIHLAKDSGSLQPSAFPLDTVITASILLVDGWDFPV